MHIIDDLVQQFSDPMAFFRELVQNAIDSGSGEVDIDLRHDQDRLEVVVSDFGEGMTREIIETRLVRLFSSGKDDDLTKIGRFGIGFVSVFAIEPERVVVETGREGQFWRVLFAPDRTYELYRAEQPLEGTQIRISKSMNAEEFLQFRRRAREAVRSWCKYASVPIYFDGEEVNEPFALSAEYSLLHEEEGTRILMGLDDGRTSHHEIRAGYYNRGLTLRELPESPFPWVVFRIDSRYLEHTLTRDQLLDDGHLQKAMDLLERLAVEELPENLISRIEACAAQADLATELNTLYPYLTYYLRCGQDFRRSWQRRPLFTRANGDTASYAQIRRAHRRGNLVLTSSGAPEIITAVGKGTLVVGGNRNLRDLLEVLLDSSLDFVEKGILSLSHLRASEPRAYAPLKKALKTLMADEPNSPGEILFIPDKCLGYLDRGSSVLHLPTRSEPIEKGDWNPPPGPGTTMVINADCDPDAETLTSFAENAEEEPELAALALLELLRPGADISEDLLLQTIRRRRERQNRESCS